MPRIGLPPCTSGLSPFWVLVACTLPSFRVSQHQPEPNWVTPAWTRSSLALSTEPNESLSAFSTSPGILPPPPGFIQRQKCRWLKCWPALLNTAAFLLKEPLTMSSRDFPSHSVPLSALLPLLT